MSESKGRYCSNPECSHLNDESNKSKHPKRLVGGDTHLVCLRCLSMDHDPKNCRVCRNFSRKTCKARGDALAQFKSSGV